jgi:hypothetical protein
MVVSSIAKSYGFFPASKIVANGARRKVTLLLLTPSCFATSTASPYSNPDGFLIVFPDACPFQNAVAGRSNPTRPMRRRALLPRAAGENASRLALLWFETGESADSTTRARRW